MISSFKKMKGFGGILIFLFAIMIGIFSPVIIMKSNTKIRKYLFLILFFQYFLSSKSSFFNWILKKLGPNNFFRSYQIKYEDKKQLQRNDSMFCCHPHGIASLGMVIAHMIDDNFFKHSRLLVSNAALLLPFSGLIYNLLGYQAVSTENIEKLMKNHKNFSLVPGGFEEATITTYNEEKVYLGNRKGFIKYALKFGYIVHPCYSFNETKLYYTVNLFLKLRIFLNKFKIPGTFFISRFLCWIPNDNIDLLIVIGKGIQFPKIENPSLEEVNFYHNLYLKELKSLFNKYQNEAKCKDLQIIQRASL